MNQKSTFFESKKFLFTGVILKAMHKQGEHISPVFLNPKKDDSYRMILNLKQLNQSVEYVHFKMESLQSATRMMTPGCYMVILT
jgi:hypothetical protein